MLNVSGGVEVRRGHRRADGSGYQTAAVCPHGHVATGNLEISPELDNTVSAGNL
jgi:hypothetical protein